jgi:hypothetical protein
MIPVQSSLPAIRDWTQPVTIPCRQLSVTLSDARRDGFLGTRLEVLPVGGYRVGFQRQPKQAVQVHAFETAQALCPI